MLFVLAIGGRSEQILEKDRLKVLFSSNRNPNFETFTDYIEKAFKEVGCETVFFENRDFTIPGRIRDRFNFLHKFDLKMLNKRLLNIAKTFKPNLFLEDGGWNILPDTLETMKNMEIKTALWTNDTPKTKIFDPIMTAAPDYDFVFVTGTDTIEVFQKYNINIKNLRLLPFACDPDFHKPVKLTDEERQKYAYDVCFVGSGWPEFYPSRRTFLESIADLNVKIGIWGPGWETLPHTSPLKKFIKGGELRPGEWVKVFTASKILFHSHYREPIGMMPHYQVNPRVFEALSCGAFIVIEKQKDVLLLFKHEKHLVSFENAEDLKVKILYYLNNEDERKKIAENGRLEVLEKHTYRHRVKAILNIVGLGERK